MTVCLIKKRPFIKETDPNIMSGIREIGSIDREKINTDEEVEKK